MAFTELLLTFLPPRRAKSQPPKQTKGLPKAEKPTYDRTRFQQFSVPLIDVVRNYNDSMPPVTRHAIRYIITHKEAVLEENIFRRSPPQDRLLELREQANKGFKPGFRDGYEAAAILRLYLREMSDPLIPISEFPNIEAFSEVDSEQLRVQAAINIIDVTPKEHKPLLWRLFKLLEAIVVKQEINKMDSEKLGAMIGPVICWPADASTLKMKQIVALSVFTQFLIDHSGTFFRYDPALIPEGGWHDPIVNRNVSMEDSVVAETEHITAAHVDHEDGISHHEESLVIIDYAD